MGGLIQRKRSARPWPISLPRWLPRIVPMDSSDCGADSALVSAVVLVSVPVSGAVAVSLPDPTFFVVVSAG